MMPVRAISCASTSRKEDGRFSKARLRRACAGAACACTTRRMRQIASGPVGGLPRSSSGHLYAEEQLR